MTNIFKNLSTILSQGGVIIIPTETVYGIAVDATNNLAVLKLYKLKSRLEAKPIQLMVKSIEDAEKYGVFSSKAKGFAEKYWPGALTIIVKKNEISNLASSINKVDSTIGIRIPNHQLLLEFLNYISFPLAVTSANISGQQPSKNSQDAAEIFKDKIDGILEGEASEIGISSTVIDVTTPEIKILREGVLKKEDFVG